MGASSPQIQAKASIRSDKERFRVRNYQSLKEFIGTGVFKLFVSAVQILNNL